MTRFKVAWPDLKWHAAITWIIGAETIFGRHKWQNIGYYRVYFTEHINCEARYRRPNSSKDGFPLKIAYAFCLSKTIMTIPLTIYKLKVICIWRFSSLFFQWDLVSWYHDMEALSALLVYYEGNPSQWRHNERDGVSDHQTRACLPSILCRCTSKKTSSASLAFVWEIHWWPVNYPQKGPVTWKMFPFDDVIMPSGTCGFPSEKAGDPSCFIMLMLAWKYLLNKQSKHLCF